MDLGARTAWTGPFALVLLFASSADADDWMRPPYFPEQPSLDAIAPTVTPMFVQETWSRGQHCREWGFHPSREEAVRRDLRARMSELGLGEPEYIVRRNGVAMALGSMPLDTLDPSTESFKVTVCTESAAADDASYRRFMNAIEGHSLYPHLPIGRPDLAWIRRYANGVEALGLRFRPRDEATTIAALVPLGYAEVARDGLAIELRHGLARARLLGSDLWWQVEERSIRELVVVP